MKIPGLKLEYDIYILYIYTYICIYIYIHILTYVYCIPSYCIFWLWMPSGIIVFSGNKIKNNGKKWGKDGSGEWMFVCWLLWFYVDVQCVFVGVDVFCGGVSGDILPLTFTVNVWFGWGGELFRLLGFSLSSSHQFSLFHFQPSPRASGTMSSSLMMSGNPEIGGCEVAKQSACSTRAWNEWNCQECMLTGMSTARWCGSLDLARKWPLGPSDANRSTLYE